jgi:hypothetical protein
MKSSIFCGIARFSLLKVNLEEYIASIFTVEELDEQETRVKAGGKQLCFHAGFLLSLFSALKMEITCSSETSVDFQWTIECYVPEDSTLSGNFFPMWKSKGTTSRNHDSGFLKHEQRSTAVTSHLLL